MAQQINLYNPIFLQKKKHFSAVTMLQALGLLLGGILLFYAYVLNDSRTLGRVAAEAQRQVQTQGQQVAQLMREFSPEGQSKLLEEEVVLETTDLFYRPVWAFEFTWNGKGKQAIVEIDSVTGQTRAGKALVSQIRGALNRDLLFDVGADTVGMIVPGGSIAVKLAKAAIDSNKKK